jgi:hypothetical protein
LGFIFFFCFSIFGSYFLLNLSNSPFNSSAYGDSSPESGNIPLSSSESISNQTYYFWNGTYFTGTPWSGSENYTLLANHQYSVAEDFDGTLSQRNVDDHNRMISNSNNWANGTHEPFWIFTNVSLGDTVLISEQLLGTDYLLTVTAQETVSLWGKTYDCWKLNDASSFAYYDRATGFLINGSFFLIMTFYYTFYMVSTNAKPLPNIRILTPSAPIYYESTFPVVIQNFTLTESAWFRNSTDGGLSWSLNQTLSYNGSHYTNSAPAIWADGNIILQVFANNTYNFITLRTSVFQVSTVGPNIQIVSPLNVTYYYRTFSLVMTNLSYVDLSWFRFNDGSGWTLNSTLTYNGSLFKQEPMLWADGSYYLQVFANDSIGEIAQRDQWFLVAATLPFNLSANLLTDREPQIALDSNSKVHVAWIRNSSSMYELVYNNNLNGHFGTPITIRSSAATMAKLNLAVDSLNVVHLCWLEFAGLNYNIYYTNNTGGTFGSLITVPGTGTDYYVGVSLAVDSMGNAHLAIFSLTMFPTMAFKIGYTNNSYGNFFTPTTIISNSIWRWFPAIAIDSNFIAHVFWVDNITGNMEIFYKNNSRGDFTGNSAQISTNLEFDLDPQAAIDSSNLIHLTWTAQSNGAYDIMYANISSGKISSPINITKLPTSESAARLSIDKGTIPETLYISYIGEMGSQYQPFITDNRKGVFDTPRDNFDISTGTSMVDIAVSPFEGITYLLWSGNEITDEEIYFTEDYEPIALLSPQNITYNYRTIPLQIMNSSRHLTQVWCRNKTAAGSWSSNYTLTWDGTHFRNSTNVYWPSDSLIIVQIFSNDSNGRFFVKNEYFGYDNMTPTGFQWGNTSSKYIQKNQIIWINGTVWDPSPGSGIHQIIIIQSNTSNGITDWSLNCGDATNFAFYNVSSLADNLLGGCYEINISIVDNAGNSFQLTCNLTVEINPPSGSQSLSTSPSNPQRGDVNRRIWVNGTCSDSGFGIAAVFIQGSNHSGWSSNQENLNSWAFYNNTPISDGLWEIEINMTDYANNSAFFDCYIFVDTQAPSGSQWANCTTPVIQKNPLIWINGSASDPLPSSGIQSIIILQSNTTNGITDWSANLGTIQNFAFSNVSSLADNLLGGCYEINISITDQTGNSFMLTCRVTVEINPPYGSQDSATRLPTNGDTNDRIWVNGTSTDSGFGIANVFVQGSNHSGWSSNQGTLNAWAFYNTTPITDGIWVVWINITDFANNSALITSYIDVDLSPPTGIQSSSTDPTSIQNGIPLGYIWVNGTATDGTGVGLLSVTVAWINSTTTYWSLNIGTNESWSFYNISAIADGIFELRITLTDKLLNARNITCMIFVDTAPPTGSQNPNTNGSVLQESNFIWINGTASDGSGPSNFFVSVVVGTGNAPNTWSPNQGNTTNWAFTNTSAIQSDQFYWVMVNVTDLAGNTVLINCTFRVEVNPPEGAQDIATLQPQNGGVTQLIWINGTAFDGGSGVKNATVFTTNITGGATFSSNLGSPENWAFQNSSVIPDGAWSIIIIIFDNTGHSVNVTGYIFVDTVSPSGSQSASTSLSVIQKGLIIWINGSALDTSPSSGILSISIFYSNTTNSIFDWGVNIGDNSNWAFYNISQLADNQINGCYQINIIIIDNAGNWFLLTCRIIVEITPPSGTQNAPTRLPQRGDANNWIWINGTAFDTGFGVASITILSTNHTGNPWNTNSGTTANWAFNNVSAVNNGPWEIWVNITDLAANSVLIQCVIFVDYVPPAGWQSTSTDLSHPQNGGLAHLVWINGTASDTNGVGLLNVSIVWTNSSAIWSVNLNTNNSWAFNNATAILDGVWQIRINFIDHLLNAQNLTCFIIVDTIAPSQPNVSSPIVNNLNVQLNWDPVPDPTGVTYYIYRDGNFIGTTITTSYLDTNLDAGTYNYTIGPVDGAGNIGIRSANMTATVEGTPWNTNYTLIIILVVGIIGVSSVIIISRKRKSQPARRAPQSRPPPSQPKPPTAEPTEEAVPLVEALKLKTKKHVARTLPGTEAAGEKAPSIVEKKEAEKVVKPKTIRFTFYCNTCKKWYAMDEFAKINCPECQNPLKLSYLCPKCKKRFIIKEPGMYDCPMCKDTKLTP